MKQLFVLLAAAGLLSPCVVADDGKSTADLIVSIWPDSPPPWLAPDQPEHDTSGPDGRSVGGKPVIRLGFVSKPELHVYQPKQNASDTAVLVCPGGGYSILAWDLEGTEIAQWLQGVGVTAIVVKYRVPTGKSEAKWLAPVQDIQRSVSLVRSGAINGVSPKRIGVLGFSAGGNAAARVATAAKRYYQPIDSHDEASANPDFAVLVYPAYLVGEGDSAKLIDDLEINEKSPPMFFAHAADDRVSCINSVMMFSKLTENGVASSLHVFASGGHGFGGRVANQPTDAWRDLCTDWMKSQGWF